MLIQILTVATVTVDLVNLDIFSSVYLGPRLLTLLKRFQAAEDAPGSVLAPASLSRMRHT